jgi:hypothetical protein
MVTHHRRNLILSYTLFPMASWWSIMTSLEVIAFYNNFDVLFLTGFELYCFIKNSIYSVLFTSYHNCSIERRFSYLYDHTSLMHNHLRNHAPWKHNYPHGMFFYTTGKPNTFVGQTDFRWRIGKPTESTQLPAAGWSWRKLSQLPSAGGGLTEVKVLNPNHVPAPLLPLHSPRSNFAPAAARPHRLTRCTALASWRSGRRGWVGGRPTRAAQHVSQWGWRSGSGRSEIGSGRVEWHTPTGCRHHPPGHRPARLPTGHHHHPPGPTPNARPPILEAKTDEKS